MPEHLEKVSEEVLDKNPWWTYKHDKYMLPNGEEGDYYYAETNDAVLVVPVLPDGRLGLVLQYRYLSQKESIEFPSGGIEDSMSPEKAAKVELKEETGFIADEFTKISMFESAPGFAKDKVHLFLAQVTEQDEQDLDKTEDMDVIKRKPNEFQEMVMRGDIFHGLSLAAWSMVSSYFSQKEQKPETKIPRVKQIIDKLDNFLR